MLNFDIGKVYTFNTVAPALLGTTIKNATLEGVLDFKRAMKHENMVLKFRQIYPALPVGTVDNPAAFTYYLFKSEAGADIVFAEPWIDASSIQLIEAINFQVTVPNASLQDMTRVRDALNALGITGYTITQI